MMMFDVYVDALYLYPSEDVDWVFIQTVDQKVQETRYRTLDFDAAFGFRCGVGAVFGHSPWKNELSYTHFESKAQGFAEGAVTSAFLGARLSLLEPFTSGSANLKLNYNVFDWNLSRSFDLGSSVKIYPTIGVKGGWIHQTFNTDWETFPFLFFFTLTATEDLEHQFAGIGPKGGATLEWSLDSCWSLIASFEAAGLWGHWSIQDRYEDNLDTIIHINTTDRDYGALVLRALLGVSWEWKHLSAHLGYEIEDWFNHFQIYSDFSGTQNNDLILQGLNLRLGVKF